MSRNPNYEPETTEAPEPPTGFDITAVIGHVTFETQRRRSPMEAAMLAIAPDAELATPGMPERVYRFDLTGREQDYTTVVVVPPEARS